MLKQGKSISTYKYPVIIHLKKTNATVLYHAPLHAQRDINLRYFTLRKECKVECDVQAFQNMKHRKIS
jgi:hypothetical protein